MNFTRMPIEIESPEQMGYDKIKYNLTESSYSDFRVKEILPASVDLRETLLCYGDHLGHAKLRAEIARVAGVKPEEVLLTAGAAAALFLIHVTFLERDSRLLVEFPNYGTNLETPKALGARVQRFDVGFEQGFRLTSSILEHAWGNERFDLVSITTPHNPSGVALKTADLRAILAMADARSTPILVDETYRDMNFHEEVPVASALSKNALSVCSLSKTFGLPGIRIGWVICRNPEWMERLLAAKEQVLITGSVLDEEVAYQLFLQRSRVLPEIRQDILAKREILNEWLNRETRLEAIRPDAGVVCFPRLKKDDPKVIDLFYRALNQEYGTWVGPGHWFEMSRRYFRLGYGWPQLSELTPALTQVSRALDAAKA